MWVLMVILCTAITKIRLTYLVFVIGLIELQVGVSIVVLFIWIGLDWLDRDPPSSSHYFSYKKDDKVFQKINRTTEGNKWFKQ